mgnify:CR=1 FL=1
MEYLDFEEPLRELEDQLQECKLIGDKSDIDVSETCKKLIAKIKTTKKQIYNNISPWQRVQLSRHPSRPYTLDYIKALTNDTFLELHGDRNIKDDKAMIGGLGKINDQTFMFIGQQKGYNTKTRQYRNFGMSNPEGYRKALRLMKSAEKFNIPVVSLIDTPGAYPGFEAEERGQGEAIAKNLFEMFKLKTQIICIVIGEGASGGSVVARLGNPGQANYVASKAGLEGFTRSLALEVGSRGITVNLLAPGFIETDMTAALGSEQTAAMLTRIPLGRMGEAKEVAAAAGFLSTDQAAYITGQTIHINGGMFLN